MSTTLKPDQAVVGQPDVEGLPQGKKSTNISLNIKITALFVALFTVVFVGVAFWVIQFTGQTAQDRLQSQLVSSVEGIAKTINAQAFNELVTTVPAVLDPANESGFGYPDSPLYLGIAEGLFDIRTVLGAGPYTWFEDPTDGKLYTAVSGGYLVDPQVGYRYKIPLDQVAQPATYQLMTQGLTETTIEPAYTDAYGSYMGAYTPILDVNGNSVGGVGVDFELAYVNEVRSKAVSSVIPVLVGIYLVLVVLVYFVASRIARPIKQLTGAATRIADGEYDLDVSALSDKRIRDEISTLAESFGVMASKVAERERTLRVEVKRLKVEINSAKRAESVSAIVDSDDFAQLAERAAQMRSRMREDQE